MQDSVAQTNAIFISLVGESDVVPLTHRPTGVDFVSSTPVRRSDLEDNAISNDGNVILGGIEDADGDFFQTLENAQNYANEIEEGVAKNINLSRY